MDDEKSPRLLTPAQKRFLDTVELIRTDRPTLDDLAYMARELVQVTLPHRNPGDVPEWTRSNGNLTLSIRPGWATDQKTGQRLPIGFPYGIIPRLLLFWLTAEAVRTRSRIIELGSSLSDFMFQLGLSPATGRGPRGDARRLRDQMERLFRATVSFDRVTAEGGRVGNSWLDMQVTSGGEVWWSPRDPAQAALWGSWIELGEKFFNAIIAHPVPLDMRALKALKRSPLALDLYAWLTYEVFRAHRSGKGRFVAWQLLAEQIGTDYADVHDFQKKARFALRKIAALYPALKLGPLRGGIRIEPDSLPAITPRHTPTVEHIVKLDAPEPPLQPTTEEQLVPTPGVLAEVLTNLEPTSIREQVRDFAVQLFEQMLQNIDGDRAVYVLPGGTHQVVMQPIPGFTPNPDVKAVLREMLDEVIRDAAVSKPPPSRTTGPTRE